jgi:tyrosine-protein kinase Etk/Wzc
VRRRWWLVAACAGIVLALGYWNTARQPRLYSATATVRLQSNQMLLPGMQPGQPRLDYRIDPLLSEQALIKSQQVAERVAQAEGLQLQIVAPHGLRRSELFGDGHPIVTDSSEGGTYTMDFGPTEVSLLKGTATVAHAAYGDTLRAPGFAAVIPQRPAVKGGRATIALESLIDAGGQVRGSISSRVVPSTDLIEITYTGDDPVTVQNVTNAVALAYQQFSSEGQRSTAGQKTRFIEQSLADQGRALRIAQDSLKDFKENNQTADIPTEAKALFTSIQAFQDEQRQLETEEQVYESLMGKVAATDTVDDELRRLAGTGVLSKNVAVAAKFEQWQDLLKQRQNLLLQGTVLPNNPDLLRINQAITDAKRDIRSATEIYLDGIKSRLTTLASTIASMKSQSERYPPLEAQQARLEANVETAQRMYTDLQSQLQLSRISESADGGTVRIIDSALLPDHAVSPNRKRNFLMSLALGLMLGFGLAVLLERLDDSVRSPLELSDNFALPVLGLIPAIGSSETMDLTAPGISRIVTHADPRSPVAEAYRSLRTNLAFARVRGGMRSLLLTSPGPADGKSTTVANLAITFAQQGQRTLLIDADLRRAVIDKTFGVSRAPGLTDVIIGEAPLDGAVHETQIPNLFVLTSGQLPPNPSELLGSARMREVLREAEEQFDVVLFDSPPLLAVTDAAVLSTMVDGTVVIARMGNTQRKALWRAVSQLRAVSANVLGGVLNDLRADSSPYYGGQGYYYYYYTPQDENAKSPPLRVLDRIKRLTAAR